MNHTPIKKWEWEISELPATLNNSSLPSRKDPKDESTLMCMVPQNARRKDTSQRDGVARDMPGVLGTGD